MKKSVLMSAALLMTAIVPAAQASVTTYNVIETFLEPDTAPRNSIFKGTFDFDSATKTVTNLQGWLSESMTGNPGVPGVAGDYGMTWLNLTHQLSSVYDATLGGLLVTTFLNPTTATFFGGAWTPSDGVASGGIYSGWPRAANNPGNAYAMIFVNTTNPLAALTQAQINKLAYADCAPGGMMGAVCMTGTTVAGYGSVGTMSGYPASQTITAAAVPAPVPEPETYAMMLAGLGLLSFFARRRRQAV